MYACCLINNTKTGVTLDLAKLHISIALELVYNDLENATPVSIATLLHAIHFFRAIDNVNQWTSHLAVAIRIAKSLGFHNDVDVYWNSPRKNSIHQVDFCRGMWLMLYCYDWSSQFADDIAFMIFEDGNTETILINHTSCTIILILVNWDDPTNIPENTLTYSKYLVPLFRLCKQKYLLELRNEPMSVMKAFLAEFDQWFYLVLPPSFRYNSQDVALKQKLTGVVNFIFLHTKLGVLKHEFLNHILLPKFIAGPVIPNFGDIVSTIEVVRAVCKPYIDFKSTDPTNTMAHDSPYFKQLIYKCAMFCILLDKYGSFPMIDLKMSLAVFESALECMPGGMVLNGTLKELVGSELRVVADALIGYQFGGQFDCGC